MKLFILCLLLSANTFANVKNFTLNSEKSLYIVDGDSISLQMRIAGIDTTTTDTWTIKLIVDGDSISLQMRIAGIDTTTTDTWTIKLIVDGDSISLQMRIAGIDTPEIGQMCKKSKFESIDCGRLSKKYLKQTLKNLFGVLSIKPLSIDHYQRILVKVYKGDIDIGKYMVERGMAFSHKDSYRQAEDDAKKQKLGFWGFHLPPIQPYKWRRLNHR